MLKRRFFSIVQNYLRNYAVVRSPTDIVPDDRLFLNLQSRVFLPGVLIHICNSSEFILSNANSSEEKYKKLKLEYLARIYDALEDACRNHSDMDLDESTSRSQVLSTYHLIVPCNNLWTWNVGCKFSQRDHWSGVALIIIFAE